MPFFIWSFLHTKLMSIPCLPRNAVGYRDMNMIVQSVGSDLAKNYNHYYHLRNHASSHITYHSISMCSSRIFSLPHLAGITKQQNLHVSVVMLYHVLSTAVSICGLLHNLADSKTALWNTVDNAYDINTFLKYIKYTVQ